MSAARARRTALCGTLLAALLALSVAGLAAAATIPRVQHAAAVQALVGQLSDEYTEAFPSHNATAALHVRGMAQALGTVASQATGPTGVSARRNASRLTRLVAATSFKLQIWPLPDRVKALAGELEHELAGGVYVRSAGPARAGAEAATLVDAGLAAVAAHRPADAGVDLAAAYALIAQHMQTRLDGVAPELVTQTDRDLWQAFGDSDAHGSAVAAQLAATRVQGDLHEDAAALGEVKVSRATIVGDAAIILFREGLEAVLILAAITASFTGERRRLRRPVFIGAGFGLLATAVTYVLAQVLIDALGDGGMRLQAITGIVAIVVLLIVTNWFFHRMYWSEWIARFNRRRKALERVEKLGFISGQTLGFVILGLTSVYREGFETVLFLQNLQVSAGTGATLLGVGIGLAATLIVGIITFALGRKLPYKRMLVVTGVLIGLVLTVMVGTTVNNLQGLGWVPTHALGFTVELRVSQWTGFYPTWEGVFAQLAAMFVVYGSYALARQLQSQRRRRAMAAIPVSVID